MQGDHVVVHEVWKHVQVSSDVMCLTNAFDILQDVVAMVNSLYEPLSLAQMAGPARFTVRVIRARHG